MKKLRDWIRTITEFQVLQVYVLVILTLFGVALVLWELLLLLVASKVYGSI